MLMIQKLLADVREERERDRRERREVELVGEWGGEGWECV